MGEYTDKTYGAAQFYILDGWYSVEEIETLLVEMKERVTTPPLPEQQAIYGMNQDDWKDVVVAISKVRDSRGIYLACRPADVFQEWFLHLGTAKLKKNI
jgi:hypothetical protein